MAKAYLIGDKGQFGFSNLHFLHADSVPLEAVQTTVVCLEAADELYALAHPVTVILESITCKTWIDLKPILTETSCMPLPAPFSRCLQPAHGTVY